MASRVADAPAARVQTFPRWLPATSLILAVLGLAVSGYLSYEHHTSSTTLSCPNTATINCVKVTTSSYSSFLGMPVSDLWLAFFLAMTALCLPSLWRSLAASVRALRLATAAGGVVFVLYLAWAELYKIDAICLWCTAVHVITAALFGVIAVGTAVLPPALHSSSRR